MEVPGPAPRVVVASDAFKGSLGSVAVGEAVRLGVLDVVAGAEVEVVGVADGGEGTVAAALSVGWRPVSVQVAGPTGEPVTATLAVREGGPSSGAGRVVLVELADACGLLRLPGGVLAPLTASSRGVGEAIRAALDLEPAEVVVGVGGSASTDGGAGMLSALGARVLDAEGRRSPTVGLPWRVPRGSTSAVSTPGWGGPGSSSLPTSTARSSDRPAPQRSSVPRRAPHPRTSPRSRPPSPTGPPSSQRRPPPYPIDQ